MAIKSISSYKDVKYRSLPRERGQDKDYNWHLAYVQSMFHRYYTGYQCENRYESEYLKLLEKYAKGEQGAKKVKEKLLRQQPDGTFKGRMKDVFQTFDILPELIDIMMSTNMKADYRPTCVAVDKSSIEDKDLEMSMAKFLVQEQTREFLRYMGIKVDSVLTEEEVAIYNDSDIDVLFKTGGIQLQREMDAIAACNTTMAASRHKEIENQNTFDLIAYGICATKSYIDHSEDDVKYRYVDPKRLIVPKSNYNDFRDISYAGEVRYMRLHEIISECPTITGPQIKELIENNAAFNKDYIGYFDTIDTYCAGSNDIFDEYLILVLDAQWLATDEEVYLQAKTSNNGTLYRNVKRDYQLDRKEKKNNATLDRKKYVKRYEALWVVGSEMLLSYGVAKDNTYYGPKGKRIPQIDYTVVKTGKKSLVDRARTTVDDINLNVAKHRSAIASLPPGPGLIIYEHALQNIKFGGQLQSMSDLISGLVEGGVLVVNGRDSRGGYIAANGGKAVEPMPAIAYQQIATFGQEILSKVNQLRQLLGLPEGLDGTAGNPYAGVGQTQIAAIASSNALFPTLSMIGPLYELQLEKCVLLWQLLSKNKNVTVSNGNSGVQFKVLSLSKNFSNYDFRTRIVFSPTEEEKRFLIEQVNQMAVAYVQTNGNIGCSKAEFFMLYKLIKANLLDEAMYQVARIEKLREQNNIKIQQSSIEANAKQNNDSIQLSSDAAINEMKEEGRLKRLNDAAVEANKRLTDLTDTYMKSMDTESNAIPASVYEGLVDKTKQELAQIEQEASSGQQPPPEQMQPQMAMQ